MNRAAALISCLIAQPCVAQSLDPNALDEISAFANEICGEYTYSGSGESVDISGNARAELEGLLRRLSALGVEGDFNANIDRYEGVLREELSGELRSVRECRLAVFVSMREAVFSSSPPDSSAVKLEKASYTLKEDSIRLQNSSLGPFCCTGRGIVIRTELGDPVGYAYFFSWDGDSYNYGDGAIAEDQDVLVSGAANLNDPNSEQVESRFNFDARNPSLSSDWVRVGELEYRAVLLDFELEQYDSRPFFKMGSLDVRLNVRLAE